MEEKKDLEIVTGNGSNLNISPVYDHLKVGKPKSTKEKPTCIVVPKGTRKIEKDEKGGNKNHE